MPNHITNILTVTGPANDVEAFRIKVDPNLNPDLEKPTGKNNAWLDFNGTVYIKDSENWYSDHNNLWSTKWNAYSQVAPVPIEGGLKYQFDTAWSAPHKWIETTSKLFPTLTFHDEAHDEGGEAYILDACKGEITKDDMAEEDWLEKHDSDYREISTAIKNPNYKEFLEYFCKYTKEFFEYSVLEEKLLKRIKDEDLPLLINFPWEYQEEEFNNRLTSSKA